MEENTLFSIAELIQIHAQKESKYKHEYQELCDELQKIYGKAVWTLPFRSGITESKIRRAHAIAQKRGITSFAYLCGIIKNDKGF